MRKDFTNVNEALDYAQSIGINVHSFENLSGIRSNGAMITELGQKVGFDIDGFSEVVPLIYVDEFTQSDGYERKEITFRGQLLHLFGTKEYYYITRMDKGKYGLTPIVFLDTSYNTFKYFETKLTAPQNIGKANKTKILNWIEYANALQREKTHYWAERKERREKALESIRRNCPDAIIREVGNAFNPFDFVGYNVRIQPAESAIEILYEFDGCGSIGTQYRVVYDKALELSKSIIGE